VTLPQVLKLIDNPTVRAGYGEALAESEAPTPWRLGEQAGEIVDHRGEQICIVDQMAPETCTRVATLIVVAVNACASLSMEAAP
jgi:hypothetical protein